MAHEKAIEVTATPVGTGTPVPALPPVESLALVQSARPRIGVSMQCPPAQMQRIERAVDIVGASGVLHTDATAKAFDKRMGVRMADMLCDALMGIEPATPGKGKVK